MNEINVYIGGQIRKYRKANGMTLQQLADVIHKSRATVCKYENGEISIDIATLYEISQALQISFGQLASYQPPLPPYTPPTVGTLQRSPFFQAKRLYFYFYDGRYHRLKDGVIDIHEHAERPGTYVASFTLCSVSGNGCSNESYYTGNVVYSRSPSGSWPAISRLFRRTRRPRWGRCSEVRSFRRSGCISIFMTAAITV